MEEEKIIRNGKQMPQLQINSDEVKPVESYESLENLLGKVLVVRNKLKPDEYVLVGALTTREGHYRVKGTCFKKSEGGQYHIKGDFYERDATAEYGLEKDEFEVRQPCYIRDSDKNSSLHNDLEIMSSLPNVGFEKH